MQRVDRPLVIAHRGVPTYRPEHTRSSYELAIAWGADHIESDLVCTADGHLVVRHENDITDTTDVASRRDLAHHRTIKVVDGVTRDGWFTEDLTLAELRTLRTRERLPQLRPQNVALDGIEPVMTFEEALDLAMAAKPRVGYHVEVKHASYFAGLGLDLGDRLVAALERRGLNRLGAEVPVTIQSFETGFLRRLRSRTSLPLIQLLDRKDAPWDLVEAGDPRTFADLTTPRQLAEIATYADAIGPSKSLVVGRDAEHRLTRETGLVAQAHAAGLQVQIWTMRSENHFLPRDYRIGEARAAHGDAVAEYRRFVAAGVDGFFTDDTAVARAALGLAPPEITTSAGT